MFQVLRQWRVLLASTSKAWELPPITHHRMVCKGCVDSLPRHFWPRGLCCSSYCAFSNYQQNINHRTDSLWYHADGTSFKNILPRSYYFPWFNPTALSAYCLEDQINPFKHSHKSKCISVLVKVMFHGTFANPSSGLSKSGSRNYATCHHEVVHRTTEAIFSLGDQPEPINPLHSILQFKQ